MIHELDTYYEGQGHVWFPVVHFVDLPVKINSLRPIVWDKVTFYSSLFIMCLYAHVKEIPYSGVFESYHGSSEFAL